MKGGNIHAGPNLLTMNDVLPESENLCLFVVSAARRCTF